MWVHPRQREYYRQRLQSGRSIAHSQILKTFRVAKTPKSMETWFKYRGVCMDEISPWQVWSRVVIFSHVNCKHFTQAAEMTTDMGMGARVNPEITVRDYWRNSARNLAWNQSDDPREGQTWMDSRDKGMMNSKGVRGEEERDFGLTSRFLASVIN